MNRETKNRSVIEVTSPGPVEGKHELTVKPIEPKSNVYMNHIIHITISKFSVHLQVVIMHRVCSTQLKVQLFLSSYLQNSYLALLLCKVFVEKDSKISTIIIFD